MTPISVKVPFVDLNWQHLPIQIEINRAISEVIQRGDFILGEALAQFEASFARACGVSYGVGVASGTDAIALGLQACGIGAGDEVLIPANTFIATVIGAIQAGATPVLVDCEQNTALIDLEAAAKAITPKTKAIVPVHLYGQMVAPQKLLDFAAIYKLLIFEDAAQAHLARRDGYFAGSVGLAAGFSFYPSKNLGAFGSGGIVVTNDETVARRVRSLRNYGATHKYFHTERGTNSRLDTLQAAILNIKLPYLSGWNLERNQAAYHYDRYLQSLELQDTLPIENRSGTGHVYHLYVIQLSKLLANKREKIQQQLAERGIQTSIHYPIPCHLQPGYRYLGYQKGDFPRAEKLSQQILSLPMYPGITKEQIEWVSQQLSLVAANLTVACSDTLTSE
ncbi:DegT/DnrJ/EryC1/StrS family aminotransferase [Pleurocapsales cyanobacterium LEGE 06147]|nr:DegT/DnrJ/EryC1/StrS family aminotransferase [Pleurocapsales cyanobacterium LEGE 06147]